MYLRVRSLPGVSPKPPFGLILDSTAVFASSQAVQEAASFGRSHQLGTYTGACPIPAAETLILSTCPLVCSSRRPRRYLCGSPPVASLTRSDGRARARQARRLLPAPACVCVPLDAAVTPCNGVCIFAGCARTSRRSPGPSTTISYLYFILSPQGSKLVTAYSGDEL